MSKVKEIAVALDSYIASLHEEEQNYILQDLSRWVKITKTNGESQFIDIWTKRQEFRSVIRYRAIHAQSKLGSSSDYLGQMQKITGTPSYLYTPSLYLSCSDIGPGLYIEHGFSTIVFAKKIGSNFWVNQNVTVGSARNGNPVILDNVRLGANSVVIGGITVQSDVTVGAGAVLNFEVAQGSTVVSQKPRVITPEHHHQTTTSQRIR
jgi:serine O-acetyltransferase